VPSPKKLGTSQVELRRGRRGTLRENIKKRGSPTATLRLYTQPTVAWNTRKHVSELRISRQALPTPTCR
jgi:hypothetical protein